MIVTEKGNEVSRALMDTFETGTTKLAAKGGFSDADRTMIYFVVNRFQIAKMKNLVYGIDPYAFLTIHEVADVFKSTIIPDSMIHIKEEEKCQPQENTILPD